MRIFIIIWWRAVGVHAHCLPAMITWCTCILARLGESVHNEEVHVQILCWINFQTSSRQLTPGKWEKSILFSFCSLCMFELKHWDWVNHLFVMSRGVTFFAVLLHIYKWLVYTTRGRGDKSISGTPPPQNALRSLSSPWLEDGSVGYKSVAFPGAVLIFIKTFTRVPHPAGGRLNASSH